LDKKARYVESIRQAYPGLQITAVELNEQGQNNDVLVVNGVWIFRFPRYAQALERLEIEAAILAAVEPYITLEIPAPVYLALEGQEAGTAFLGYRRIEGEPLWRETYRALEHALEHALERAATLDRLAGQLAGFLRELHGVPVAEVAAALAAAGHELPRDDTHEVCADLYRRMREKLFPHMRPDARDWAADHFETFLGKAANFEYEPVLKHSDFGTSNILFDPASGRVRGILDFGSAGLGDPAYDFAGLLSSYGEGFVRRCARVYPELEGFLPRVRFYQGTFALYEALFGVEHGDEAAYRAGMARYV
jgi:aminoglycoside 2''-phosphotransferase